MRRIQRLTVGVNGGLHVHREVRVRNRGIAEILFVCLRDGDALTKLAAWAAEF